ncbi:MAG: SUF system NifU family Fe-S cluster assembly protein [Proteobacteria bacterium]|jgi:nitrogen fixation protein NifU and related proteins|nr:SUF system NifU family Fe-S cluster assembly protein [Pseudomonadota bacterium]
MSDLRELYQEVILDHGKNPRNFGPLPDANREAHGHNPLCGDKLDIHVKLDGDIVSDVKFEGAGCAISVASASLMTEALKGKTEAEAKALFEKFHELATGDNDISFEQLDALDKLAVFQGVRDYPMRVKCATLSWHTMQAALDQQHDLVVTE